MSTINPNQFSVKVKVPQGILYNRSEKLAAVFKDILEGYIGRGRCRVTARCYLTSLRCRFTVILDYVPSCPDSIRALVGKVAVRTVEVVITEKNNRSDLC